MGLIERIHSKRIYLDANIFVYLFEGFEPFLSLLIPLIEQIEKGRFHSVTSELSLAETLVKPLQTKNEKGQEVYKQGIQTSPTLSVVPVTRNVLTQAASIRAEYNCKMPDAIHLATAGLNGCGAFLTNDKRLKAIKDATPVYLD